MKAGTGDIATVVAVDAFGGAGIIVSLLDFFVLQGRQVLWLDPLGVAVFLVGAALEVSALRALGTQYSLRVNTNKGRKLVQSGPYRSIRHPVYLGLISCSLRARVIGRVRSVVQGTSYFR